MPVLMSTAEMQQLAQRLAKMRLWRAKWTAWGMDRKSHYDLYRNATVPGELHTRLTLPNKGIRITFVERKEQKGSPDERGRVKMRFRYVEARVEPLPAPAPEANTAVDYVHIP